MLNKTLIMLGLMVSVVSVAHASGPMPSQSLIVREMLQIDANIALMNERKRLDEAMGVVNEKQVTVESASETSQLIESSEEEETVSLVVHGIYGVGNELFADIGINGSRVRFKRGREVAERVGPDFPYRLKSINPPCATLINAGTEMPVCLGGK